MINNYLTVEFFRTAMGYKAQHVPRCKVLEPFLKLANLDRRLIGKIPQPWDRDLEREVWQEPLEGLLDKFLKGFGREAGVRGPDGLEGFAHWLKSATRRLGARSLYRLFYAVSTTLENVWLSAQSGRLADDPEAGRRRVDIEPYPFAEFAFLDDRTGKVIIEFGNNPYHQELLPALDGLEFSRLRKCPIESCDAFFYAWRRDKGACDQHLALARVRRSRSLQKRAQYKRSRITARRKRQRRLSDWKNPTAAGSGPNAETITRNQNRSEALRRKL